MLYDWDMWPYMVAEGAGGTALVEYRIARSMRRIMLTIGVEMYGILRHWRFRATDLAALMINERGAS